MTKECTSEVSKLIFLSHNKLLQIGDTWNGMFLTGKDSHFVDRCLYSIVYTIVYRLQQNSLVYSNKNRLRSDPMFDYTPHPDCCNSRQGRCCESDPKCSSCNSSNCQTDDGAVPNFTDKCKLPNPCGKADVMQSMWRTDIQEQLCK